MFKFVVVILLVIIALSVNQAANNQSLTEQDKHQLFVQKQKTEKLENEKQAAKEQEQLQNKKEIDILKSKSFSELKTTEEQARWIVLKSDKPMIILIFGFFCLILINKFRQNAP